MKNLILGTAGHVDHGKTALIKAITGIDCDTHPDEKLRGITINLGFSHFETNNLSIGIIDVPGHKDFISTMAAGAFGIDFVLFTVAADSGIMPQTEEHLKILELLGIKNGIIVITKIDLVDEEVLDLVRLEIKNFSKGTFLENCIISEVSSKTGQGIEDLKSSICKISGLVGDKKSGCYFRMFIDRIFSVKGFGTVVTGTSLGGEIKIDENVYLLPGEKKLRIRRIEKHGTAAEIVKAGSRVSLNLTGLNKENFKRGMVISAKKNPTTQMIDAKLWFVHKEKSMAVWSNIIFLSGTHFCSARMHLLDRDVLISDDIAIVQIHLTESAVLLKGDKFIIRDSSGNFTLGGGEIIDAHPLHHKRRPVKLVNQLKTLVHGSIAAFINSELNKNQVLLNIDELSELIFLSQTSILKEIQKESVREILFIEADGKAYFMLKEKIDFYEKKILKALLNYHNKNPLDELGKTKEELSFLFKNINYSEAEVFVTILINELLKKGLVIRKANTIVHSNHKVIISDSLKNEITFIEEYYRKCGMHLPAAAELEKVVEKNGINFVNFNQILTLLVSKKILIKVNGNFIFSGIVNQCRHKLLCYFDDSDVPITVAKFRDITNGNRKMCLHLLNYFDDEGITIRDGDFRTLTEKGKVYLKEL